MFEKSLTDLIRGIRANKKNEQKYITACLQEIRNEVKSNDLDIKSNAISKLTYLQMLGYDMSWASFYVVEVMSSAKFLHKRAGYLAATLSFQQDTDVLMLTTNLIKKDLASPITVDIGIALNGLSHIATSDLARDLSPDLVSMLNHSRPYIRKKVVLVLYKIFLKYPEALRLSFPRLKEKLEDPDPSVVSAVVSVICELARKNPKNYLSLAPQLFKLLTTSSNNWMLIKIIKLFASLTPLEPRLIKKLLPPLTSLIQTTPAMSLLYECIYTVITGGFLEAAGDAGHALAVTCTNKLRKFLEDPDQNLKYVGLLAMGKLLLTHPKLVAEHKDLILECIDDEDISIRIRALDLVVGMVHRKNLTEIVQRLLAHIMPDQYDNNQPVPISLHDSSELFDPIYRIDIIHRIVFMCSQSHYHHLQDFEWYISVLVELAYHSGVNVGELLTNQLMDVTVRVKSVREYSVKQMYRLLQDKSFLETAKKRDSNIEVLSAAAWICGEYCHYLTDIPSTLEALLTHPEIQQLPVKVQMIYVQNIIKIYAYWTTELAPRWDEELQHEFTKVTEVLYTKMDLFIHHHGNRTGEDLEVQERAHNVKALFLIILDAVRENTETMPLELQGLPELFFMYELNPVAPKAQSKVPVLEGLDLDAWIYEPLPDLVMDDSELSDHTVSRKKKKSKKSKIVEDESEDEAEKEKRRAARREARKNDPYYIHDNNKLLDDIDSIPIVELNLEDSIKKPIKNKHKKKKVAAPIYAEEEMPENATLSDGEDSKKKQPSNIGFTKMTRNIFENEEEVGLNRVDLSTPLSENEKFEQPKVYLSPEELRMKEEARYRAERKAMRALQEKNNDVTHKSRKGEHEMKKKVQESTVEKKKKKKRSNHKEKEQLEVNKDEIMRDAINEKSKEDHPIEIFSNDQIAIMGILQLDASKENNPRLGIDFTIKNKEPNKKMLPDVHMEFVESLDIKLNQDNVTSMIASATEHFELQSNEEIECKAYFDILTKNIRKGLCIKGDLFYNTEDVAELTQFTFEIPIPISLFLIKYENDEMMNPNKFALLLAEHGQEFEHHDHISLKIELPSEELSSRQEALTNAFETITKKSGLMVVEVIAGAASLYGQSVIDGAQIAGLLKCNLSPENDENYATLTIDLKSTDNNLLEGLVEELSSIQFLPQQKNK
ncbi:adaptin N terminal region-domain-containing protein [Cokeromyces recurvatus]|uniref:adaptin N terminal region-domain-containing protein n=1 Tax=Cokeromyces recurvatus TaxID=90255 RepID=UPI00221F0504|nr:adaptin N terminal region-domain-containing protein [Cokeromyces recurvatus]KAI7902277.1 adaptin N terminal region-domain-containing protein [Cokeromyces recurvatus]